MTPVAAPAATPVDAALAELEGAAPDILATMVASVDGLPVAHRLGDSSPESVAAMAATAAGLGKRIVDDFGFDEFAESVVRASGGYFVVYSAGRTAVLAVLASSGANLGRIHLQARRCAAAVAAALGD